MSGIVLSDDEFRAAEPMRWRFTVESLDAVDLAVDLEFLGTSA